VSDEWTEWLPYRAVYGPAWRTVERWGYTNKFGYLDPDEAQDVAFVLAEVRRELGDVLDGIDPETVADAVRDAMEQRRPRC
jgi:hypothetical protein